MTMSANFITGGNALMSLPLKASLNKLWSMLNSQQIVVQLPLMEGIKFPANASSMNEVFLDISNFEIISSEMINDELELFYLPEVDPYNLNFLQCGYDTHFYLQTLGFPLYIMLGHFTLLILFILLTMCNTILRSPRISIVTNKLKKYLFWNGFIRLYMELYSGLALSSVLSIYSNINDYDSPFRWVRVSFYASVASLVLLALLPIFFVIFYCIRRDKWSEQAFRNMYGALLEGTKVTKDTERGNLAMLLVPTIFFYRRLIFIGSIILL